MIDSHDDEDWKLILILDLYLLTIVMMKILVRLMVMRRQKNIIRPLSKLKDVQYYKCGLQKSSKFNQVHHLFFGFTSKTDSAFTSNTLSSYIYLFCLPHEYITYPAE